MRCFPKLAVAILAALLCANTAICQDRTVTINVLDKGGSFPYVSGYARTVSGATLAYHSSHPDATSALLVRAQKDQTMVWESDTLQSPDVNGFYHLIWLAGLACRGLDTVQAHHFDLSINGQPWFHLANRKDSTASNWEMKGKNGAVLRFKSDLFDRYGDLFGMMSLTLPKSAVEKGKSVTLQITAEDAGSADWCMTFQYRFELMPRVRLEPTVLEGPSAKQLLRVSADNLKPNTQLAITTSDRLPIRKSLGIGANVFFVPVEAVSQESALTVVCQHNGLEQKRQTGTQKPVVQRDIYLLPYAHTDIGYTDLQDVVLQKHCRYIDDALRLIGRTKDYPEDARFKWNIEVLWPLETYMQKTDSAQRGEFVQAVKNGSIGVNAFYANVLTGLMSAEELDHCFDYAHSLSKTYALPINTAVISDIPGFTWGTVNALAHNGVRYFASATNPYDRIGHILENWGDKPFWWKSQSGKDSVLMWMPAASYATFHQGSLPKLGAEKVFELTRSLDAENYPYRIVQMPYTLGDNAGVDTLLPDFVKQWNETYASPHLIIATHQQMFEAFDKEYGKQLPSYAGDLTPYWEDGAMSSAVQTITNRRGASRLRQAQALWKMLSSATIPDSEFAIAWHDVILFDEHTWGAAGSIDQPDDPQTKAQWRFKQEFARHAAYLASRLTMKLTPESGIQNDECEYDVCNTSPGRRTDLVVLTSAEFGDGDVIVDAKGKRVPSQRMNVYQRAVLVEDVPANGAKRIRVNSGKNSRRGRARSENLTLSNEFLSVEVDKRTGAFTRLYSKGLRKDFADSTTGLNRLLYVAGTDPDSANPLRNVRVQVVDSGCLVASLRVEGETAAGDTCTCVIRLIDGINRVDITHRIIKKPVRTKESLHIAFPFNIPDGQIRYDVAGAIIRPELDQLPGSNKNFFSVNSWVDLSNKDYGITLATPDIPLAEFGKITAEQPWREHVAPGTTVYSYVLNNYWHTNFKADQEGIIEFHYSLQPHGPFDSKAAAAFGEQQREPLIVVPATEKKH